VPDTVDIAIVGAGAAGIMAAIWAGRTARTTTGAPPIRIVAFDSARRLGAKILVAGGGRCNVTHHEVSESAYAGSSREMIRRVLRRFDVPRTIEFFRDLGVELKREETGKLFPTTDEANTVLRALLDAAAAAGVPLRHPCRIGSIRCGDGMFMIESAADGPGPAPGVVHARRLILATGGKALPKTGSDGQGYHFAQALGHSLTPRIFPALVPLTLPRDHHLCGLSGLRAVATLELRTNTGKRLVSFTNSLLCTHFGLSGPAVLDISRYYTQAVDEAKEHQEDPPVLTINWLPGETAETLDQRILAASSGGQRVGIGRFVREDFPPAAGAALPERLIEVLCLVSGVATNTAIHQLTREQRQRIVRTVTEFPLPITGDRGYTHAEVTAGGVPLAELNLKTMESRLAPGLYLCGEICDVDGRIGGFNFQWAWASGYVAGSAAAQSLL
jgi:predicted Rossmann fold flavoprotein